MNTTIIQAYFKGTGLTFPSGSIPKEKFMRDMDGFIKDYEDDVEFYYNQMEIMERTLCENSKLGVSCEKEIIKAADDMGLSREKLVMIWFCNIHYLLKKGRIPDDDKYGYLIYDINEPIDIFKNFHKKMRKDLKICGNCGEKAKLYCGKCNQAIYCCKDCQVKDWKKHKKVCGKQFN